MSQSHISMKALHEHMEKLGNNEVVLDVRSPDEFAEGHVRGAINIPHDEVARHADKLKAFDRVYIHCRSGKRSQLAFADLEKCGLKNLVCISEGGMADWITAGWETVKGA